MIKIKRCCRNCKGRRGKWKPKKDDSAGVEDLLAADSFKYRESMCEQRRNSLACVRKSSCLGCGTGLDYQKMIDNVNLTHPRVIQKKEDGTILFEKLPLSTKIGNLLTPAINDQPHYEQFD